MKIILKIFLVFILSLISYTGVEAECGIFDLNCDRNQINIECGDGGEDCSLKKGTELVKGKITDIESNKTFSEYIQSIVVYLLTFISIIAVIYIIYAGFMILTGAGDEEKMKKSKQTILYVIIGIILIWLAYPITLFIIDVLNVGEAPSTNITSQ